MGEGARADTETAVGAAHSVVEGQGTGNSDMKNAEGEVAGGKSTASEAVVEVGVRRVAKLETNRRTLG